MANWLNFIAMMFAIDATIEAGGCEVEGCDAPPGMTHLHHLVRWADDEYGGQR